MAYTDITSQLLSQNYASVANVGSFYRGSTNAAYGFVASAYNGTTYLASNNLGVANSAANLLLSIQSVSNPINVKFTYYIHSEASYDYGIFGNSGSSITSSATYSNSMVYASTYGNTYSASPNTVIYYITGNTTINVFYKKDNSVDKGWDRMLMTIAVEQASGGGGSGSQTCYYWAGGRFVPRCYRKNINNTYVLASTARTNLEVYLSDSVLVNSPKAQLVNSGTNAVCWWISGSTDDTTTGIVMFAGQTNANGVPIDIYGGKTGHDDILPNTNVYVCVKTGTTAASVLTPTGSSSTAFSTSFGTVLLPANRVMVYVTGKGSTAQRKAYYNIAFGSPINSTFVTGKNGFVKLITSAVTSVNGVSVTATREGSASETGTAYGGTACYLQPTSATNKVVTVGDLKGFDSLLTEVDFGEDNTWCITYDSSAFDTRFGATNRLMHIHDFLSFANTPAYFKDETEEQEGTYHSFNWTANTLVSTSISLTGSWVGSAGNWRGTGEWTGSPKPITVITGQSCNLYINTFDVTLTFLPNAGNQMSAIWVVTLQFLDSSNNVLQGTTYSTFYTDGTLSCIHGGAIAFGSTMPAYVRMMLHVEFSSTQTAAPSTNSLARFDTDNIGGTGQSYVVS